MVNENGNDLAYNIIPVKIENNDSNENKHLIFKRDFADNQQTRTDLPDFTLNGKLFILFFSLLNFI